MNKVGVEHNILLRIFDIKICLAFAGSVNRALCILQSIGHYHFTQKNKKKKKFNYFLVVNHYDFLVVRLSGLPTQTGELIVLNWLIE